MTLQNKPFFKMSDLIKEMKAGPQPPYSIITKVKHEAGYDMWCIYGFRFATRGLAEYIRDAFRLENGKLKYNDETYKLEMLGAQDYENAIVDTILVCIFSDETLLRSSIAANRSYRASTERFNKLIYKFDIGDSMEKLIARGQWTFDEMATRDCCHGKIRGLKKKIRQCVDQLAVSRRIARKYKAKFSEANEYMNIIAFKLGSKLSAKEIAQATAFRYWDDEEIRVFDQLQCNCNTLYLVQNMYALFATLDPFYLPPVDDVQEFYSKIAYSMSWQKKRSTYKIDNTHELATDLEKIVLYGDGNINDLNPEDFPKPITIEKKVQFEDFEIKKTKRTKNTALRRHMMNMIEKNRKHSPYWSGTATYRQSMIHKEVRVVYETLKTANLHANDLDNEIEMDPSIIRDIYQLFAMVENLKTKGEDLVAKKQKRVLKPSLKSGSMYEPGNLEYMFCQFKDEVDKKVDVSTARGTLIKLFFKFACALQRDGNPTTALETLKSWLFTWDENGIAVPTKQGMLMHPVGVVYFILQIEKRGLCPDAYESICLNRNLPLTKDDLTEEELYDAIMTQKYVNVYKHPKLKTCMIQLKTAMEFLSNELNRLRIANPWQKFMFEKTNFMLYAWKYYYPHTVEGTADENDPNVVDPEPFENQTAFTPGFLQGKVNAILNSMSQKARDLGQPITDGLNCIYERVIEILTKMEGFLDNCIETMTGFLDKIFGSTTGVIVRTVDMLELLLYYVIYQNVTNRFFKCLALFRLLTKLGLIEVIKRGLEHLYETSIDIENWFKRKPEKPEEPSTSNGVTGTSDDEDDIIDNFMNWFNFASTENLGRIAIVVSTGLALFAGYKITQKFDYKSIGVDIVNKAKNLHFLGAGLFGLERIMKYAGSLYERVKELIKEIFNKSESEKTKMSEEDIAKIKKKIIDIEIQLLHYASHQGLGLIRTNMDEAEKARIVVEDALKLFVDMRKNDTQYDVEAKKIILGFRKNMIDVLNAVQRVQNILKPRETPFHIQFYAEPGVGKSTLLSNLTSKIAKEFYPKRGVNAAMYAPNQEDKFWPGYVGQPIILVDEMYPVLDAETLVKWMIFISNVPVMVPMAELSEKVTYFTSEWILSNTNVPYPQANGVASIEAVWRRRHMLVKIETDERVMDQSTHKFSKNLFDQFYPGQDTRDFPHLKFHLCKPVANSESGEATTDGLPYMETDKLPNGISLPTKNLTYAQLWDQIRNRQACLKQEEQKLRTHETTLDMLDVNEIWQQITDYYNTNKLRVRDKAFFELNLPDPEFYIDQQISTDEPRHEATIENTEVVDKTATEEGKNSNLQGFFIDVAHSGDKTSLYQLTVKDGALTYHLCRGERLMPDVIMKCVAECEHTPQVIKDWIADHQTRGGVMGTSEGAEGEIEKLERMVNSMKNDKSKTHIVRRMEKKLDQMKNGTPENAIQMNYSNKFDEFVGERYFGSEEVDRIRGNPVIQPTGPKDPYTNDLVTQIYLTTRTDSFSNYRYVKSTMEPEGRFEPTEHTAMEGLLYRHNFFLTRKELQMPIWLNSSGNRNTSLNYLFLNRIVYQNGEFWFRYTPDIIRTINQSRTDKLAESPFNVMCDLSMANSLVSWSQLTVDQKHYILKVRDNQRRAKYSELASYREHVAHLRNKISELLEGRFYAPYKEIIKKVKRSLYLAGGLFGIVYAIRQLGKMFGGVEETSKVYFKRAPLIKGITGTADFGEYSQHEQRIASITKNVIKVIVQHNGKTNESNGLGIVGNLFLMCKHPWEEFLQSGENQTIIKYRRTKNNNVDLAEAIIRRDEIFVCKNSDLVFINSPYVHQFKSIVKYFYQEEQLLKKKPDVNGITLVYERAAEWNRIELPAGKKVNNWRETVTGTKNQVRIDDCYVYDYGAPKGSSGGILINKTNDVSCIIGFQCFTDGKRSYASTLFQEQIARVKQTLGAGIENEGPYQCDVEGVSPTEELITSNETVIGTVPHEAVLGNHMKTAFIKTPIHELVPKSARIPAILNPMDERIEPGQHFLQHSINKYGRDVVRPLDRELLVYCAEEVGTYYKNAVVIDNKYLNMEEVILGIENIESINNKTSPGIPWVYNRDQPGKKSFIQYNEQGEISFLAEEVEEEFKHYELSMMNGIIPPTSAYEFPKDELRPIEKVNQLKTRSIRVINMIVNMIYRKYHGHIDASIRRCADGNHPICVGINPESLAWNEMYKNLKSVNDVGMDFDVGNWDGHMPHEMKQAVTIMNEIIEGDMEVDIEYYKNLFKREITEDEVKYRIRILREALSQCITYGYVQFLDIVIQMGRGLGSGYAATTDENCKVHAMLVFYLYNKIIHRKYGMYITYSDFVKHVKYYVYGDDLILTMSPEMMEVVSYGELIDEYEYYGWPITTATKTGNFECRPIEDLQFLKRQFKPIIYKNVEVYVGAIDQTVAYDLCYWMKASSNNMSQFYENLNNAVHFMWAHGEDTTRRFINHINNCLKIKNLQPLAITWKALDNEMKYRLTHEQNEFVIGGSITKQSGCMLVDQL